MQATSSNAVSSSSGSNTKQGVGGMESTASSALADARYACDDAALAELRAKSPWMEDPKYFKKVAVSPSAIMKMLMHCHSGVEKGIKKAGKPIEVMGLILGRPDPSTSRTLVISDVYPLPIEGFETRVIADDDDVTNYMITLGESIEHTRKEKFMGWYHSHPFDVGVHSQCFLSQTDLTTQLAWQRAEDPHGNPFVAVVIDPLRSLARSVPEIMGFRVYPPDYNSPVTHECPDGSIVTEESARIERWGNCWARYYCLKVEYYMSGSARSVMETLTQNYLWVRTLGNTPMLEAETRDHFPDRIAGVASMLGTLKLDAGASGMSGGPGRQSSVQHRGEGMTVIRGRIGQDVERIGMAAEVTEAGGGSSGDVSGNRERERLDKACQAAAGLAKEQLQGNIVQLAKSDLFL